MARQRLGGRAPHPSRIGLSYVFALLLLIFLCGMLLAGTVEAHVAGDQFWVFLFSAGLISTLILYFTIVVDFLRWVEGYEPGYDNEYHFEDDL